MVGTQKSVKTIVLGILLTVALTAPLSAQAWVFLDTPQGGDSAERQYFISRLPGAIQAVGWEPVLTKEESDLYITAGLTRTSEFGLHTITVRLYNSKTDEFIATNAMGYSIVEEMDDWNRYLIYELTSQAPLFDHRVGPGVEYMYRELSLFERLWGEKQYWMHLGARVGGDLRFYSPIDMANTSSFTFDAGLQFMVQALPFLGIQIEALFTADTAPQFSTSDSKLNATQAKNSTMSLMFPVILMIPFRPDEWLIAPFGGIYINVGLGNMTTPTETLAYKWDSAGLGWTAGIEVGRKVGPGTLFTDVRYISDLGDMISEKNRVRNRRFGVSLSLGYSIAFKEKKPRDPSADNLTPAEPPPSEFVEWEDAPDIQ